MPEDPYEIDARFYDAIHDGFDEDIGLWLSFAGQTDQPVLVVGCGTGRVAVPLARSGHRVTALDPSSAMLARARRRADTNLDRLTFVHASFATADLSTGHFGFVLFPADVFLYCPDTAAQLEWLERAASLLTFNGRLAIDLPGPQRSLDAASNGQPLLAFRGHTEDGEAFQAYHLHEDDLASQSRWLQVTYEVSRPDGSWRRWSSEHQLRYVYPAEIEHLIARAGLRLAGIYGDYDLGILTNDSDRMLAIAERAGR